MRVVAAWIVLALIPQVAWACATCSCGDPTLTVMGAEKPFAGRVRAALMATHRTDAIGEANIDQIKLSELRFDISATYAPTDWLLVSTTLPLLHRTLRYVNLRQETFSDLGDLELRARAVMWQDSPTLAKHMLSAIAALEVPTAPRRRTPQGALLADELQPGSGSVDPAAGLAYSFFDAPWSVYASTTLHITTHEGSRSLRGTGRVQYQATDWLAVRAGPDMRLDSSVRTEPHSGGFIGFVAGEVLISPLTDMLLTAMLYVPTINALNGHHQEGLIGVLGIVYDL